MLGVRSVGNDSLSSAAQAEEPAKSGKDVGAKEKKLLEMRGKLIDQSNVTSSPLPQFTCHVSDDSVSICDGKLDELGHGSSSFLN